MNRTFHVNVGWWYWLVIALTSILMFVCFWEHYVLFALLLAIAVVFQIEMLVHTQYIITGEGELRIESGRFAPKSVIDIDSIISIKPVHSMTFPAPTLSARRLEVVYRSKKGKEVSLHISPKNEEDFIRCVLRKNAEIVTA